MPPFRNLNRKIVSLAELAALRETHRDKTIVLCHGTFDLVHPGHIAHLEEARELGDILVVTLTADDFVTKKRRCMFGEDIRQHTMANLAVVDYVSLVADGSAVPALEALKPDFYVKGSEYEKLHLDTSANIYREKAIVESYGGQLHFTRKEPMSSTKIGYFFNIASEGASAQVPGKTENVFKDLAHLGWKFMDYKEFAFRSTELDVVVVGETIVDRVVTVRREGVSPKSKCITGEFLEEASYVGGSAAVALHLAPFVRSVTLLSNRCTLDAAWDQMLAARHELAPEEIVKTRFRDAASGTPLFELKSTRVSRSETIPEIGPQTLLMMVDYGHGLCDEAVRQAVAARCNPAFTAIMAQTNSSNYGFNPPTKYQPADYFSLNTLEARLLGCDADGSPERLAASLANRLTFRHATVTAGSQGAYVVAPGNVPERVEAACNSVSDPVGCGDAFFAFSALALATGAHPRFAAVMGNLAAALVGQKEYSFPPVSAQELTNLAKIAL